jgi:hypothetical protein
VYFSISGQPPTPQVPTELVCVQMLLNGSVVDHGGPRDISGQLVNSCWASGAWRGLVASGPRGAYRQATGCSQRNQSWIRRAWSVDAGSQSSERCLLTEYTGECSAPAISAGQTPNAPPKFDQTFNLLAGPSTWIVWSNCGPCWRGGSIGLRAQRDASNLSDSILEHWRQWAITGVCKGMDLWLGAKLQLFRASPIDCDIPLLTRGLHSPPCKCWTGLTESFAFRLSPFFFAKNFPMERGSVLYVLL